MKPVILKMIVGLAAVSMAAGGWLTACSSGVNSSQNSAQTAAQDASCSVTENNTVNNASQGMQTPVASKGDETIKELLSADDYDRAINEVKDAIENQTFPDESLKEKLADAYIARAWFYKSKRLNPYTLTDLFSAVEAAPEYYRAHYEMGRFHNNQWQFSIGLVDLNKSIALKPDFAPAHAERAYSQYKSGKYDPAMADVNKAIEMDPAVPGFYCTRSLIYLATDQADLALADADRAIRINPAEAASYYNRSLIYTATGKPAPAIDDLETTISLSGDDLLMTRARADLQKLTK